MNALNVLSETIYMSATDEKQPNAMLWSRLANEDRLTSCQRRLVVQRYVAHKRASVGDSECMAALHWACHT